MAEFCWDALQNGAKVVIDYSPGPGSMAKVALTMGMKTIAVFHNQSHADAVILILVRWLKSLLVADTCPAHLKPADLLAKLENGKHENLKKHQERGKESAVAVDTCRGELDKKRDAMGVNVDSLLGTPAKRAKAAPPAKPSPPTPAPEPSEGPSTTPKAPGPPPAAGSSPGTGAGATSPSSESSGHQARLASLLAQWSS